MNTNILRLGDYQKRIFLSFFFISALLIIIANVIGYQCFKRFYTNQYRKNEELSLYSLSYLIENSEDISAIKIDNKLYDELFIIDESGIVSANFTSPNHTGQKTDDEICSHLNQKYAEIMSVEIIDGKKYILSLIPLSFGRYLVHTTEYSNITDVFYRVRLRFIMFSIILLSLSYLLSYKLGQKMSLEKEEALATPHAVVLPKTENSSIEKKNEYYDRLISLILEYLSENYSNPNISASFIADKYHISTSHLSRLFSRSTGTSFPDYLSDLRLNAAQKMLQTCPDMSVVNIAHSVGYLNASYFTAQYKKKFSITPTQYRKQLLIEDNHK